MKNFRYALQDWEFKDGTKIPKGTAIFTNQIALHLDEDSFADANTFDPWRMYRLRAKEGEATKHQYVMTGDKNLHFGHGKHACPGRFFAANEIKTLLVLFLMRYDVRLKNMSWPEIQHGRFYSTVRSPTDKAIVEFKDRTQQLPADLKEWFL